MFNRLVSCITMSTKLVLYPFKSARRALGCATAYVYFHAAHVGPYYRVEYGCMANKKAALGYILLADPFLWGHFLINRPMELIKKSRYTLKRLRLSAKTTI